MTGAGVFTQVRDLFDSLYRGYPTGHLLLWQAKPELGTITIGAEQKQASPSLVVVDKGMASSLSTTTISHGTYAFFFNQRGLMGGLGLQSSKITRIHPQQ